MRITSYYAMTDLALNLYYYSCAIGDVGCSKKRKVSDNVPVLPREYCSFPVRVQQYSRRSTGT